jgi:hypothetical protein
VKEVVRLTPFQEFVVFKSQLSCYLPFIKEILQNAVTFFCNISVSEKPQIRRGLVLTEPYTECPGRNVKNFGRVFLMLKYTDITQNTYIQS